MFNIRLNTKPTLIQHLRFNIAQIMLDQLVDPRRVIR